MPARAVPLGAALSVLAPVAHAGSMLAPLRFAWPVAAGATAAFVLAVARREWPAAHALAIAAAMTSVFATRMQLPWPLYFLLPLAAFAVPLFFSRSWRAAAGWFAIGAFDRVSAALSIATVAVSSIALVTWHRIAHPDLSDLTRAMPPWPVAALLGVGVVFALLNALIEEAIWRGVWMHALDAVFGPGVLSVVVQGASFGIAHLYGFPRGVIGVAMAGVYGIMLGALRRRSRGMLVPIAVHVFADVTIFAILLSLVRAGH